MLKKILASSLAALALVGVMSLTACSPDEAEDTTEDLPLGSGGPGDPRGPGGGTMGPGPR